jgi:hypothetical protein
MGFLEDKLVELYSSDIDIASKLDSSGAISGDPPVVDVSLVSGDVISIAKAHVLASCDVPEPFVYNDILITVTSLGIDGIDLVFTVEADCILSNPYTFRNPSIYRIVSPSYIEQSTGEYFPSVEEEAPDEALKDAIGYCVYLYSIRNSWS